MQLPQADTLINSQFPLYDQPCNLVSKAGLKRGMEEGIRVVSTGSHEICIVVLDVT
jgi:hypothetical protein